MPVLSAILLRPGSDEPWLVRKIAALYEPTLRGALKPSWVAAIAFFGLIVAGVAYSRIGQTFMPTMDEGTPVITVRTQPTISINETADIDLRIQREILSGCPRSPTSWRAQALTNSASTLSGSTIPTCSSV